VIVLKFGGTSVADETAIQRVAAIVAETPDPQRVVVVSAMAGVTDRLFEIAALAGQGARHAVRRLVDELAERHVTAAVVAGEASAVERLRRELGAVLAELRARVEALAVLGEVSPRSLDAVAAAGELLSSRLVACAIAARGVPVAWLDPRALVVTDERHGRAQPRLPETAAALERHAAPFLRGERPRTVVTGGYVGATTAGITTTLGRGGSDYSAAIVGRALGAREIQIWTDVDGILTADPRLVPDARPVPRISAAEAAELADFGAKVLHPSTLAPAIEAAIPLRILNSRRPEAPGTIVVAGLDDAEPSLAAVACKRGVAVLELAPAAHVTAAECLARLVGVFAQHDTPIDVVTSAARGVSVVTAETRRFAAIVETVRQWGEVACEEGMAILGVVGEGVRRDADLAGRVLRAFGELRPRLVAHAASRRTLAAVVRDAEAPAAVRCLHARLFADRGGGIPPRVAAGTGERRDA
jgi:aspartate kinase